jgi:hypothetical protein
LIIASILLRKRKCYIELFYKLFIQEDITQKELRSLRCVREDRGGLG